MAGKNRHSGLIFFLTLTLIAVSLSCKNIPAFNPDQKKAQQATAIGFDLTHRMLDHPQGDLNAQKHLFIHNYPMPGEGLVTGTICLEDADETPESVRLLILRPGPEGWKIIHSLPLPADDHPGARSGIDTFQLNPPLPVKKGDIFAHWHPDTAPSGPIPYNSDDASIKGLSVGKYGFRLEDVQRGKLIPNRGFTGQRDYFINLIFQPASQEK